jgi:hypothetical protein
VVNQSTSKNEIARDIENGKQQDRYKDCTNLRVGERGAFPRDFFVECVENSLENPPFTGQGDSRCPADCLFFRDRSTAEAEAATARRKARIKEWLLWGPRSLRKLVDWYGNAPWQTQILVMVIVLSAVAPRVLPPIAALLTAILHGDGSPHP